ncbi:hypothetical protein [Streptomyces sp. ISL-94]|uniref:hypothetical protein n=1 Tax=Streptomyces sp. ISL-94 TaxID=2819190 RepID=UPI001BECDA09|nr:hypothetical protein [Streptomyces sp. ISL-94]MBT2478812.1 hypothetical protein [Streptomyces sp. ISL-94]
MIHGFRPPRWLACAALAAAALVPAGSACAVPLGAAPGAAPRAAAVPRAVVADDPGAELAGSPAGVGRERPGRPVGEPANPEMLVASRPLPVRPPHTEPPAPPPLVAPSPPQAVTVVGTEPNERAADLAAHILPLGTGCALMGVGLGYLGMRLRRGL